MRSILLVLSSVTAYYISPATPLVSQTQLLSSLDYFAKSAVSSATFTLKTAASRVKQAVDDLKRAAIEDLKRAAESGGEWTVHTLASIDNVKLRSKATEKLCDSTVKQVVGYLDVEHASHTDHFFFCKF